MSQFYVWKTVAEIDKMAKNLARGMMAGGYIPEVDGEVEGQKLRFCGIWAKNRMEWHTSLIACMHYKVIVVGFFDAMGAEQVDFILDQTELSTIVCEPVFVAKIVQMKKDGQAEYLKNLVIMDDKNPPEFEECTQFGINVILFQALVDEGANLTDPPKFEYPTKHDPYMFGYTSGTTGDSKGVKVTHNNMVRSAISGIKSSVIVEGDAQICYLPLPHAYEQVLFVCGLLVKSKFGYY